MNRRCQVDTFITRQHVVTGRSEQTSAMKVQVILGDVLPK
jgi:hypothetical protein